MINTVNSTTPVHDNFVKIEKRPPRADNTITRADLAAAVYKIIGTTRTESAAIVDVMLAEMFERISSGEIVKLHNFGKFVIRQKGKREGRNPRTLEPAVISERRIVQFKPSPALRGVLNKGPAKASAKSAKKSAKRTKLSELA